MNNINRTIGIAITISYEECIACHVQNSIKALATKNEIVETILG